MNQPSPLSGLLEAVASGDRRAFSDLYVATSPKLFGVIIRIVRQRMIAEEVLQEAYVAIWKKADGFDREKGSAISWMCTVARNRALDNVRRAQLVISDRPVEEHNIADGTRSPLAQTLLRDDLDRLDDCLEQLDAAHASAIRFAYLDGASREELSERFGVPVGTIKTWLRRNLIKLKDCLGNE